MPSEQNRSVFALSAAPYRYVQGTTVPGLPGAAVVEKSLRVPSGRAFRTQQTRKTETSEVHGNLGDNASRYTTKHVTRRTSNSSSSSRPTDVLQPLRLVNRLTTSGRQTKGGGKVFAC